MDKLKALLLANVNVSGLITGALEEILVPALKKAVAETDTKLDDAAVEYLAPVVVKYVKEVGADLLKKVTA